MPLHPTAMQWYRTGGVSSPGVDRSGTTQHEVARSTLSGGAEPRPCAGRAGIRDRNGPSRHHGIRYRDSAGSLQSENGLTWSAAHRTQTVDLSETLVRLGILRKTEARLTVPNFSSTSFGKPESGKPESGFGDFSLGLKQLGPLPGGVDLSVIAASAFRQTARDLARIRPIHQASVVQESARRLVGGRDAKPLLEHRSRHPEECGGVHVLHRETDHKATRRIRGVRGGLCFCARRDAGALRSRI